MSYTYGDWKFCLSDPAFGVTSTADLCGRPHDGPAYPCCVFRGERWAEDALAGKIGTAGPCDQRYWKPPTAVPGGYNCPMGEDLVFDYEAFGQDIVEGQVIDPYSVEYWCEGFHPPYLAPDCTTSESGVGNAYERHDVSGCHIPCVNVSLVCSIGLPVTAPIPEIRPVEPVDHPQFFRDRINLALAWQVLADNIDIVEWLACVVVGGSDYIDCLTGRIEDPSTVHIEVTGKGGFKSKGRPIGRQQKIIIGQSSLEGKYGPYLSPTSDSDEHFCAIVDLAATLLHELVHTCLHPERGGEHADDPNDCRVSYLIETSFRWAMAHRFPCLPMTCACSYWDQDAMFLNHGSTYPNEPPGNGVIWDNPC